MIAAPCQVEQASYNKPTPDAVHLNFIHILSKLNITIKTDLSNLYTVKLLDFKVMNMPVKGNFDEADAVADQTKKNSRWSWDQAYTNADKADYLTGIGETSGIEVSSTKKYIVESLVIPQDINYERVALDGKDHALVNTPAVYFTSYEEYAQATPVEDPTVTASLFADLYIVENNTKVLRTYAQYKELEGKEQTTENQYNALLAKIEKTPAVTVDAYVKVENTVANKIAALIEDHLTSGAADVQGSSGEDKKPGKVTAEMISKYANER